MGWAEEGEEGFVNSLYIGCEKEGMIWLGWIGWIVSGCFVFGVMEEQMVPRV